MNKNRKVPYNYRRDITEERILDIARKIINQDSKNVRTKVLMELIGKELNCSVGPIRRVFKSGTIILKHLNLSEDILFKKRKKIKLNCSNCDKVIYKYHSYIKNKKDIYCCKLCYNEHKKIMMLGKNNPNYNNNWSNKMKEELSILKKKMHKEGKMPWSKGLTKETDNRLVGLSEKIKENHKNILNYGMRGRRHSVETKELMCKNHRSKRGYPPPFWLGGKSFEPYTLDFNRKLKIAIRKRDNQCMVCNTNLEILKELGRQIHIHHVDYDKKNSFPQNLITLCNKCHIVTNFNRERWKIFFQSLLKEKYNYEYTQDQKIILDFMK